MYFTQFLLISFSYIILKFHQQIINVRGITYIFVLKIDEQKKPVMTMAVLICLPLAINEVSFHMFVATYI
jgi:hypothetical protein